METQPPSNDVRLGLPSASMADRMMNCPGSPIPGPDDDSPVINESAERGDRIHDALRLRDPSKLEGDEVRVFNRLLELRDEVVEQWCPQGDFASSRDDRRIFLRDKAMRRIFSGQMDEMCVSPSVDTVLIIDFKTGQFSSVEDSWQIRAYGVLSGAEKVRAAVIREAGADVVEWGKRELELFEAELREGIARMKPFAPRRAGSWCAYCPARGGCSKAGFFATATKNALARVDGQMYAWMPTLTLDQIAEIYRQRSTIRSILDKVEEVIKGMNEEQLKAVGLRRKPNAPMRSFTDMKAVRARLADAGVQPDAMDAVLKFGVGDAELLLRTSLNLTAKEAKTLLSESCSDLIAIKEKADSVEAIP